MWETKVVTQCSLKPIITLFRSNNKGPPIDEITNELKLRFYGLFKQVSTGPCNESAPSRLKVVQRMKWYDKVLHIFNAFFVLANSRVQIGRLGISWERCQRKKRARNTSSSSPDCLQSGRIGRVEKPNFNEPSVERL